MWYNAPTMLPDGGRQHRGCIIPQAGNTQSSAPEYGRVHRPKHVELIGTVNKTLLLHLFGVYIIYINDAGQTNIKLFTSIPFNTGCFKVNRAWNIFKKIFIIKKIKTMPKEDKNSERRFELLSTFFTTAPP